MDRTGRFLFVRTRSGFFERFLYVSEMMHENQALCWLCYLATQRMMRNGSLGCALNINNVQDDKSSDDGETPSLPLGLSWFIQSLPWVFWT